MNSYVILFAFICGVAAIKSEDLNVGTVLFSPSDVKKKQWSAEEIALLRARLDLQALIPSPSLINTNEDFVNTLLSYFKNSYSLVNSIAKDPVTDSIMNAALSDALGGYLKAWVLPITKFAYYGGTVSQEDASKLFQLYKEIKQSLDTDGRGWRSPNTNLLNSVSINIASLRSTIARAADDPCDSLAYLEKTKSGLAIPVPSVNWNSDSQSMFVPLKNESLIPLLSSNNESLTKYYNAASKCIEVSKLENQKEFETRFQKWLIGEVIPHLNDEKFYPALGNVLSLVNKTRDLVDTVIDLYAVTTPIPNKTTFIGIPIDMSSKKMMIVSVIIILEVAWCIPTLCYFLCVRIKRKKKEGIYVYVEKKGEGRPGKKGKIFTCISGSTQCSPKNSTKETACTEYTQNSIHDSSRNKTRQGVTLIQLPRPKSCTLKALRSTISSKPSIGLSSRSYHNQQLRPLDISTVIYEQQKNPKDRSFKINSLNDVNCHKSSTSREVYSCITGTKSANITDSSITNQEELEPTKTVTVLREQYKASRITENIRYDKETQQKKTTGTVAVATENVFMSVNKDSAKRTKSKEMSAKLTLPTNQDCKTARFKNQNVNTKENISREKVNMHSGKPYLEISVDRPSPVNQHITVDLSVAREQRTRQSRIPKRACNSSGAQTLRYSSKNTQSSAIPKRKSSIPQPYRQNTDTSIKRKKTSTEYNTLNMTF